MSIDKRAKNLINASLLPNPGPYLARIVNNVDPTKQGSLEVELLRPIGNQKEAGQQLFVVRYLSPFYGCTGIDVAGTGAAEFNDTQKSYGFWAVPPDVGVTVMVIFVDSDPGQGFWMGCVQDALMNYMIPGIAASNATQEQVRGNNDTAWQEIEQTQSRYGTTFLPVGEVNRKIFQSGGNKAPSPNPDVEANKKPIHPIAERLLEQGTINDPYRGVYTSSARRESPSNVYGWSTPGPVDKRSNAIKGKIGRAEGKINKFVSRMGGHCIIMDDGDERYLRKTRPWEGPPEYVDVENPKPGEEGLVDFPKDEAFRIRTRKGAQILMHCSEDFISIINSRGTAWIELSSNGKIDMYAREGVHFGSGADIQMTATRHISLHSDGNQTQYAGGNHAVVAVADASRKSGGSTFDHSDNDISVKAANYAYLDGQSGAHVRGELINIAGNSYDWNVGGNLMMNVQGNFELRAQNALLTSDFQTHLVSGSDTRVMSENFHLISGGNTFLDSYGTTQMSSNNVIALDSGGGLTLVGSGIALQAGKIMTVKAGSQLALQGGGVTVKSGSELIQQASKIHLNGPDVDNIKDVPLAGDGGGGGGGSGGGGTTVALSRFSGNVLLDENNVPIGEVPMGAGSSSSRQSTNVPAKEAIEADQATGAAGNQTAGGGFSTLIDPIVFPVPGYGPSTNKRVPTSQPWLGNENRDPVGAHVRLINADDPRTTPDANGKQYTIRTNLDIKDVPSTSGGYADGAPMSRRGSHYDPSNMSNSNFAAPLDKDYTAIHARHWTKDQQFLSKVQSFAGKFGLKTEEVLGVFGLETGFTMSPSIRSPGGTRVGLIQMGEAEANEVGTTTGALSRMSRSEQLDWVEKHLSKKGNITNVEQMYLAVVAPSKMNIGEDQEIYKRGSHEWKQNHKWHDKVTKKITRKSIREAVKEHTARAKAMLGSGNAGTGSGPQYPTQGNTQSTPLPTGVFVNPQGGTNPGYKTGGSF